MANRSRRIYVPRLARALQRRPTTYVQALLIVVAGSAVIVGVIDGVAIAAGWPVQPGELAVVATCSLVWTGPAEIARVRKRRQLASLPDESQRARVPTLPPPGIPDDVFELVRREKKILAIKRYRQLNPQVSLKEAKDIIDAI